MKGAVKKAVKRVRKAAVKKDDTTYYATLSINEQVFEASGKTAIEAFRALVAPIRMTTMLKMRSVLTLKRGDLSSAQVFFAVQLKRFLLNNTSIQIFAKRLDMALKKR